MNVLFLQSYPEWNSMTTVHATLIKGLAPLGVEVHVACPPSPDPARPGPLERLRAEGHPHLLPLEVLPGLPALRSMSRRGAAATLARLPLRFAQVLAYLKRHRIELVHVATHNRDIGTGLALARLAGLPLVVHQHIMFVDWFRRPTKVGFRKAAGVVAVSQATLQTAIDLGGLDPRRGQVVHNVIDLAGFRPNPGRAAEVRASLGVGPDAPLVGMVARTVEWKGHARLIAAMDRVRREAPEARLVFIGGVDPHEPESAAFAQHLEDEVRRLGLEEHVRFPGPRRDVADVLAALDVFAMPSRHDPCALAFLEAMAAGKAIIGETTGGTPELTEHGVSALLVPPDDIPALAETITSLVRDPARRARLGKAARERVEARHQPHHAGLAMRAAFERILEAS